MKMKIKRAGPAVLAITMAMAITPAFGQAPPPPPPPAMPPQALDQLVARVALYPDPLLAQILAASTYPDQIQPAAGWSDQHHYLTGQALANAITGDQLPWDPSVQALLPFPSVLDMMASDMNWTTQLGNAFLAQQQDVMEATQRERMKAQQFGYLRTNRQIVVSGGPYISIAPVDPGVLFVPYYDPAIVFFPARPGFFIGGAIGFNFSVAIGGYFRPWGWGYNRFDWGAHALFINNARWGRTWVNRGTYVHPYAGVARFAPRPGVARAVEQHQLQPRSERERAAPRQNRGRVEEHGERR
jgi:hypothetical protein